ncbi:MAG: TonB-dependent receptor [Saprospiraceae bacterium]|nr:TonB-dependent receptor [Saprospiraceae bacterium]
MIYISGFFRLFSLFLALLLTGNMGAVMGQDTLRNQDLEEITVVATRLPTNLWSSARSIHREDLSETNHGNPHIAVDEALLYSPGVFALNPLNFAQDIRLSIRGFGSRSAFGIRGVKVLVDGIPATTPDGQTQLDHLDMQHMATMEIMNGAAAGLYGNASGGTLHLRRKVPEKDVVHFAFKGGAYGYVRPSLRLAKVMDKYTIDFSALHQRIDGYRMHARANSTNLTGSVTRQIRDGNLTFQLNYLDAPEAQDPGGINFEQVLSDRRSARMRNEDFGAGEAVRRGAASISYNQEFDQKHTIDAKAYLIYRDFANFLPFEEGGAVAFERAFGGLQMKYSLQSSRYRLLAGLDVESQSDDRRRNDNLMGRRGDLVFDQKERFTTTALYLLQELSLTSSLKVDLTGRLDLLSTEAEDKFLLNGDQSGEISWQHFSPSIGINQILGGAGHLFARFAHSFETPALSELSNNPTGTGGFNQELLPQLANHFEVGGKGFIARNWAYNISVFHIDLKQELVPFEIGDFPGRTFYRNAGRSRRNGLEASLTKAVSSMVKLQAAYTFSNFKYNDFEIDGRQLENNRLPGIPQHFGSLGVMYGDEMGWYGSLDTRYTGLIYLNDANTMTDDKYLLLHSRLGYRFVWGKGRCDIHGGLRNTTGTRYNDNIRINAFGGRFFEPAPLQFFFFGAECMI